jgi:hypothetical protein
MPRRIEFIPARGRTAAAFSGDPDASAAVRSMLAQGALPSACIAHFFQHDQSDRGDLPTRRRGRRRGRL